jgi:hypothetical protein
MSDNGVFEIITGLIMLGLGALLFMISCSL